MQDKEVLEEDEITICNQENDEKELSDIDLESVVFKGSDVDYVRANIHCASSIGHARRKEFEAAALIAEENRKRKSEKMKPGEKYASGSVPKYLQNR